MAVISHNSQFKEKILKTTFNRISITGTVRTEDVTNQAGIVAYWHLPGTQWFATGELYPGNPCPKLCSGGMLLIPFTHMSLK